MSADETERMQPADEPADDHDRDDTLTGRARPCDYASIVRTVGHDLSAPLAAIRIAAEMLTSQLDTPSLTEQGEHLQRLTRHAEALVSDLVRVSAGRERTPPLTKRAEPLGDVIRDAVAQVSVSKEVALDVADMEAEVDRDAIGRVIVNVVTNAVRHTPRHTPVSVSLTAVGDDAVIRVSDLGSGIPEAERERVVQPFQRNLPPEGEFGVGLGLTIADLLVRAHRGKLTIDSNDPQGTVVTVRLPLRSPLGAESGSPGGAR